jgi:hypothetical protein
MLESKTTKIYVKDFCLKNITKSVLEELDVHFRVSNNYIQLYSTSGIFIIEKNKVIKQVPNDVPLKSVDFEDSHLILDDSYFKEEEILSQIPFHNYIKESTQFYYSRGDDSKSKEKAKLQLIVEGHYESGLNNNGFALTGKQKYTGFIVDNFYFLAKEELDNYLMKKELNVFLSMLK